MTEIERLKRKPVRHELKTHDQNSAVTHPPFMQTLELNAHLTHPPTPILSKDHTHPQSPLITPIQRPAPPLPNLKTAPYNPPSQTRARIQQLPIDPRVIPARRRKINIEMSLPQPTPSAHNSPPPKQNLKDKGAETHILALRTSITNHHLNTLQSILLVRPRRRTPDLPNGAMRHARLHQVVTGAARGTAAAAHGGAYGCGVDA